MEQVGLSLALVCRNWGAGFSGGNHIWVRGLGRWWAVGQVSGGGDRGRAVLVCLPLRCGLGKGYLRATGCEVRASLWQGLGTEL